MRRRQRRQHHQPTTLSKSSLSAADGPTPLAHLAHTRTKPARPPAYLPPDPQPTKTGGSTKKFQKQKRIRKIRKKKGLKKKGGAIRRAPTHSFHFHTRTSRRPVAPPAISPAKLGALSSFRAPPAPTSFAPSLNTAHFSTGNTPHSRAHTRRRSDCERVKYSQACLLCSSSPPSPPPPPSRALLLARRAP